MKHVLVTAVAALVAVAAPSLAQAAPPPNDAFAAATAIAALPHTELVDVSGATAEPGEPQFCWFSSQTVWYSITPSETVYLRAGLAGSPVSSNNLNVYRSIGSGIGDLFFRGCGSFGAPVTFVAEAGVTYYVQAESLFGSFGSLRLSVEEVPPPANDGFAAAIDVAALPFSDTRDLLASGREPGEPSPSCGTGIEKSIWYRYTPSQTGSVSASWNAGFFPQPVAVYRGDSLASLTELGCRNFGSSVLTFRALAGTTYYLQLGAPGSICCGSVVTFSLRVAPAPVAAFTTFPSDPSQYDSITFWGLSTDPGGAGIVEELYDFGDGTQAVGCCPNVVGGADAYHTYAADGDYTVTDTVTTADGRTASTTKTISVRTHDVAIEKLTVPQAASAGQTRTITVGIGNTRYDEQVSVRLLLAVPGQPLREVGSLQQGAPARNRLTAFSIDYTFDAADAAAGKVTFKAVAMIVGSRDAVPADNEAIALPTKVNG